MKHHLLFFVLLFSVSGFSQNKLEVFFDFNKDVPNEFSQNLIENWLSNNKNAEITKVLGYCDSVDDNKYNRDLAMRRINSMLEIFKTNNIRIAEKVELKSFGEDFKYSKLQGENRKVEVFYTVSKEKKPETKTTGLVQTPFGKVPGKPGEATREIGNEGYKEKEEDVLEPADLDVLVEDERATLSSKFAKAKTGDLVRISNINFYFNQERVMDQSMPLLDELLDIMLSHPNLIIEIHGHICCNPNPNDTKLSYRRALVILKFLNKYGVDVSRLAFRGYGSNDPIYKLPEKNEKERAANRRVEILIVNKE